ncbi:MAG: TatD family hydrolase [Lachnospiraceae bacterium]
MIFDSHAHYDDSAFDKDRDRLLAGLSSNGVGYVMNVAANLRSIPKITALTKKYNFIYGSAGVHPSYVKELNNNNFTEIEEALDHPKILAVGEIGLDYHYDNLDKSCQKKWFAAQIDLAKRTGLPLILHSRDAAKDTLDIITAENAGAAGGVMHCFAYGKEMARSYLDQGFYIGVGGVVTFKNARKLKEVVEYMPLERILLETDCPYLAPTPFRGKRNDSTLLSYVVEAVAEIKKISKEEVINVTTANALTMYRLN